MALYFMGSSMTSLRLFQMMKRNPSSYGTVHPTSAISKELIES
ncbi:hypothetical protein [Paenibacillus sp. CF384]|nr:hypothetical protein [Paenibacillus sp. CF384]